VQKAVRATAPVAPTQFLIHGAEYFSALSLVRRCTRARPVLSDAVPVRLQALRAAQHRVFISGWWLAPDLKLRDGRAEDTLISLLRDAVRSRPRDGGGCGR
jgi:hypothetical protein